MRSPRRPLSVLVYVLVVSVGLTTASCASTADHAAGQRVPGVAAADRAARWLAGQVNGQGFIPTLPGSTQADLSATTQTILALGLAHAEIGAARRALGYVEEDPAAYTTSGGSYGPGQLAILILDAVTLKANPRDFGDQDLVSQLLSTRQVEGGDTGLFGTQAQIAADQAGSYDQGLALAALAAAGFRHGEAVSSAVDWLANQQCPDGGWTLPDVAANGCSATANAGGGPDTNSTAVALEGLAAEGALTHAVAGRAVAFLAEAENGDAGWPYMPGGGDEPAISDPDSTSLVIQALVAARVAPTGARFSRGVATPLSELESFQIRSGRDSGSFSYPPADRSANVIATYQAIPALLDASV